MENVIPDGCEFTVSEIGELYESGEPFPEKIQPGDKLYDFETGYEYVYAAVPYLDKHLTEDGVEYVHLYDIQEDMVGWFVNVYDSGIKACGELRSEWDPCYTMTFAATNLVRIICVSTR